MTSSKTALAPPEPWTGFERVIVGVGDMQKALALWRDALGFTPDVQRDGPDAALCDLWNIGADSVSAQAVLRTPGQSRGAVHLVEFGHAARSVRTGANTFDRCPKNLDIHAHDLPDRVAELKAAGYQFKSDRCVINAAPDGTQFREAHLPVHDDINVVLLEVIGEAHEYSSKGFAGVSPLVCVVADAAAEKAFYRDVLGLHCQVEHELGGPEIERMIGLPSGTRLEISIWNHPASLFGGIELVCYHGVTGDDLYALTRPPARGIVGLVLGTESVAAWLAYLQEKSVDVHDHGRVELGAGAAKVLSLRTPAGFAIEMHQPD